MTAINYPQTAPTRRPNPLWPLLLAIIFFASVTLGSHAVVRHGQEAKNIRSCLHENEPYQRWRSLSDRSTFYNICELPDGRFGIQAITKKAGEWFEKTAYIKGDGTWKTLHNFLTKFATRWKQPLP